MLERIRNFVAIDADLATAGQPDDAQLVELSQHGFAVVINLGLLDPEYCLPDEAGSVAALGMIYHHVPVSFRAPRTVDYARFCQVMQAERGRKIFVHCAMNYRVACFTALYGEAHLGWSRDQADAHVRRIWQPDQVWTELLSGVRAGFARAP